MDWKSELKQELHYLFTGPMAIVWFEIAVLAGLYLLAKCGVFA